MTFFLYHLHFTEVTVDNGVNNFVDNSVDNC